MMLTMTQTWVYTFIFFAVLFVAAVYCIYMRHK